MESGAPAAVTEDAEVALAPAAAIPAVAPNAGQQRLLEEARASGLQYAAHLPNFVCTEVTRRLLDPAGKQEWRNLDESLATGQLLRWQRALREPDLAQPFGG